VRTKRTSLLNLAAKDAERARRVAIVNDLASGAKMQDLAQTNVSVRMRAMAGRDDMDVTWVFPSRRKSRLWIQASWPPLPWLVF
jgi:hypothetical protein